MLAWKIAHVGYPADAMMFDIRNAPIRFARVGPGRYVSTCEGSHRPVRELAVDRVDRRCGYTMEYAPSPAGHRAEYDLDEARLAEVPWDACPLGICGRYRIYRTTHSGRGVTHDGKFRWWTKDVGHDNAIALKWAIRGHQISLKDAVKALNVEVGAERDRVARVRADREAIVISVLADAARDGLPPEIAAARIVRWLFEGSP